MTGRLGRGKNKQTKNILLKVIPRPPGVPQPSFRSREPWDQEEPTRDGGKMAEGLKAMAFIFKSCSPGIYPYVQHSAENFATSDY